MLCQTVKSIFNCFSCVYAYDITSSNVLITWENSCKQSTSTTLWDYYNSH